MVHEAVRDFGVGAEIVATVMEEGFDELDAPVLRVGAPFMPAPFATSLEQGYAIHTESIARAVRQTL